MKISFCNFCWRFRCSNAYKNLKCYIERLLSDVPMFEVNAVMLMSEIVLEPTASEMQNIMLQAAKDYLER